MTNYEKDAIGSDKVGDVIIVSTVTFAIRKHLVKR